MAMDRKPPRSIDEYVAAFSPGIRAILERIRSTIAKAAPGAQETISYRIPAFTLSGALVYFAAFKEHIGFYPPVREDARLERAVSPYAGEKGNLRFPLDRPIPYGLIGRIVRLRVKQNLARAAAKRKRSLVKTNTARVDVENVKHPGRVRRVDGKMYEAMKRTFLGVLPKAPAGLSLAEIQKRLIARLPQDLFPKGAKAGWWAKTVQLDLEAKGVVSRTKTRPLRLYKS